MSKSLDKIQTEQIKKVLYNNLDMLFDRLENQNQDLDKLDSKIKGGSEKQEK